MTGGISSGPSSRFSARGCVGHRQSRQRPVRKPKNAPVMDRAAKAGADRRANLRTNGGAR
jgi:hypothetical protein